MQYTYTVAWAMVGGISIRDGSPPIELASSEGAQFILTSDPDPSLANVDEASAVGRLMLKGVVGQDGAADFPTALASEIEEIRGERRKKVGGRAVLICQARGEIETTLKELLREHDTFIITFDAVEKRRVRQMHRSDIEAMKVVIACESDVPSQFVNLSEETYLLNDEGKRVYSMSFSVSAEASSSTTLSEDTIQRISARYAALNQANDLDSVERLFCQMAEYDTDRLKAFLSGWAALEILIAKSFKSYEQAFFSPFINAEQPTLRERFLDRIKGVMKDKYRLTDKFIAVTAVLFPGVSDVDTQQNFEKFRRLKKQRDSIFHGEAFSERDLPVHELAALLRKYVIARVIAPNNGINA